MKISKEELQNLYIKQKLSSPQIAKIYNLYPERIRWLLRKYGIPIRTKSEAMKILIGVNIPKNELRELYQNQKFSSDQIAKKYNCSPSLIRKRLKEYDIKSRTVREAKGLTKPKYPRKDFSGNLEEKAYLIGFRLGDLHVRQRNPFSPTIIINSTSTKIEQIELIKNLFLYYGHTWISKPDRNNAISIRCYVNRSFDFLFPKQDMIEPWILKNDKAFAAFFAGYIDAEGTFAICGGDGVFHVRSNDKNIIWQIRSQLMQLEVLCPKPKLVRKKGSIDKKGIRSNADVWMLMVYRKDSLLKLIKMLKSFIKHTGKIEGMEKVKDNIIERNIKYNNMPDRRFKNMYIEELKYVRT